jgi:xanthine dehydrogenase accessory factor
MRRADAVLDAVLASLDRREAVALVTVVAGSGDCSALTGRHLALWLDPALPPVGELGLDPATTAQAIAAARQALAERRARQLRYTTAAGEFTLFVDVQAQPPHLIIAGAGHVAAPLAAIAHICEFTVTVLDDRPQFANRQRFPTAERVIAGPFRPELRNLRGDRAFFDPHTYIVLVTRGHQHDIDCLLEVLDDPVAYIGMIGSKRRVRAVFELLEREQGIPHAKLARVHAPIGLAINAQTPQEIAVSIMAEVIGVMRAGGARGGAVTGDGRRAHDKVIE